MIFTYIGNCKTLVDEGTCDATHLAQIVSDSNYLDVKFLFPFIDKELIRRIAAHPYDFECGIHNDRTAWILDKELDMHYFYLKGQ